MASKHSQKAMAIVSPRFDKLAAAIVAVKDANATYESKRLAGDSSVDDSRAVVDKMRAMAQKKLVDASIEFEQASDDLRVHIVDAVGQVIDARAARQESLSAKALATALPEELKQDIRTYLVISSLQKLMGHALEYTKFQPSYSFNKEAEYFDTMLHEALIPQAQASNSVKARTTSSAFPAFTINDAFRGATINLEEPINTLLAAKSYGRKTAHHAAAVGSFVLGGAASVAAIFGLTDNAGWLAATLGTIGGGGIGVALSGMASSWQMNNTPRHMIAHAGGGDLAAVRDAAQPLMQSFDQVSADAAAKMLGDALSRAARNNGKGGSDLPDK